MRRLNVELLEHVAASSILAVMRLQKIEEANRNFTCPIINTQSGIRNNAVLAIAREQRLLSEIYEQRLISDSVVADAFGFDQKDRFEMDLAFDNRVPPAEGKWRVYFGFTGSDISDVEYAERCFSWWVGITFGRWNVRATSDDDGRVLNTVSDAPLTCSPGMLQNADGLPATPANVPDTYPFRIAWPGILVDDKGHSDDIEKRVQDVMEVIWPDRFGDIETEACQILGVAILREYFRRPAGFFADHLQRYSKSRRQAPIYWPLSTSSGSYTL